MKKIARFRGPLSGSADHRQRALEAVQPEPTYEAEQSCVVSYLETQYVEDVLGKILRDTGWNTLVAKRWRRTAPTQSQGGAAHNVRGISQIVMLTDLMPVACALSQGRSTKHSPLVFHPRR